MSATATPEQTTAQKLAEARAEIGSARRIADDEALPALDWGERVEIVAALGRALRLIDELTSEGAAR